MPTLFQLCGTTNPTISSENVITDDSLCLRAAELGPRAFAPLHPAEGAHADLDDLDVERAEVLAERYADDAAATAPQCVCDRPLRQLDDEGDTCCARCGRSAAV